MSSTRNDEWSHYGKVSNVFYLVMGHVIVMGHFVNPVLGHIKYYISTNRALSNLKFVDNNETFFSIFFFLFFFSLSFLHIMYSLLRYKNSHVELAMAPRSAASIHMLLKMLA